MGTSIWGGRGAASVFAALSLLLGACAPQAAPTAQAPAKPAVAPPAAESAASDGQTLLNQLVEGAKQEKELVIGFPEEINPGRAQKIIETFNKQFGLSIAIGSSQAQSADQVVTALTEQLQGVPPSFDVLEMGDTNAIQLVDAGAVMKIPNWDKLLEAIDPSIDTSYVSSGVLEGSFMTWGHRVSAINYRSDLIKAEDLPRRFLDLADPKYKGLYSLPPYTSSTRTWLLVYDKDELLAAMKDIGQNAGFLAEYVPAVQRMLLGEIQFAPGYASDLMRLTSKDPATNAEVYYFKDPTPVSYTGYLVRTGTKSPNAAQLFTLWAATTEANKFWETEYRETGSLALPSSAIGNKIKKETQGISLVCFACSQKGIDMLKWLATDEGKAYSAELGKAQLARQAN